MRFALVTAFLVVGLAACGGEKGPDCGVAAADAQIPAEPVVACATDDANEPNDSFFEAADVSSGSAVVCSDSEDFWRIDVPKGETVTASITFDSILADLDINLLDACGTTVTSSSGTDDTETVTYLNDYAGENPVYLQVYEFGFALEDVSYTFTSSTEKL